MQDNLFSNLPEDIYEPSDDTFLLLDVVKDFCVNNNTNNFLEVGAGSGFISII